VRAIEGSATIIPIAIEKTYFENIGGAPVGGKEREVCEATGGLASWPTGTDVCRPRFAQSYMLIVRHF
jgi:hypothetical protein